MFEKFKTLVLPTYKNGWKKIYPTNGATCAIILVKGNVVVADVVFHYDDGIFEGNSTLYNVSEVLKFYEYDS